MKESNKNHNKKELSGRQKKKQEKKIAREQEKRIADREVAAQRMKEKQNARYDENGNVVTKYDKKRIAREQQEARDRRNSIIARSCIVVVLLVAAIWLGTSLVTRLIERFGTAVTVADEKVDKIEYDYYYGMAINNFMSMYGSYASYFGLDLESDLSKQSYSATKSWEDFFNDSAVDMLKQTKVLKKEAESKGFTYDTTQDYDDFKESLIAAAKDAGVSEKEYYKDTFGAYASSKRLEPYVKEYLFTSAYLKDYSEKLDITEDAITAYYEEHKNNYDIIDYRSISLTDQDKANEMLDKITDGESFRELCKEYAPEDVRDDYVKEDKSLSTGARMASISAGNGSAEWLFDDTRKEGDKIIFSSSDGTTHYVLYFIKKYQSETLRETVASDMRSEQTNTYLQGLIDTVTVKNGTVKLVEEATEGASESSSDAATQESTESSSAAQ